MHCHEPWYIIVNYLTYISVHSNINRKYFVEISTLSSWLIIKNGRGAEEARWYSRFATFWLHGGETSRPLNSSLLSRVSEIGGYYCFWNRWARDWLRGHWSGRQGCLMVCCTGRPPSPLPKSFFNLHIKIIVVFTDKVYAIDDRVKGSLWAESTSQSMTPPKEEYWDRVLSMILAKLSPSTYPESAAWGLAGAPI